jgi:hypothetical protein
MLESIVLEATSLGWGLGCNCQSYRFSSQIDTLTLFGHLARIVNRTEFCTFPVHSSCQNTESFQSLSASPPLRCPSSARE